MKNRIIDSHFHIYEWDNDEFGNFYKATERYIEDGDFCTININALPSVERDVSNNILVALFKLRHPAAYAHGGLIYETYPLSADYAKSTDSAAQYRELMQIGFDGIKLLETKPSQQKVIGSTIDSEYYEGMFELAEKDGTHFVWHVADPPYFWDPEKAPKSAFESGWFYGDKAFPSCEDIYRQVFRVLERHPMLNVTFAHFMFLSAHPERVEEIFEKYPNVNFDITPASEIYEDFAESYSDYRNFFSKYSDRIEYGTDCSDQRRLCDKLYNARIVRDFLATDKLDEIWGFPLRGIKLDDTALDNILCNNFLRHMGKKPKPINTTALKEYFEKYRHLITDKNIERKIEKELTIK